MSRGKRKGSGIKRQLRFEPLEDRRMLAAIADIIFLVDESGSGTDTSTHEWLQQLVTGDSVGDGDDIQDMPSLLDQLSAKGINDVRYGLVGYGQVDDSDNDRFSHSQLFPSSALIGNPSALTTADLNDTFEVLANTGGREDGWDAIEHAIAEYDFRPGAVPVLVMVHHDEGRVNLNEALTRPGVLAALRSKNVILNSMVVGNSVGSEFEWEPLVNLADYGISPDIRVLGIEADGGDGFLDARHEYHWIDTNTQNSTVDTVTETTSDALQISYNGSNTGETGMVASGKSVLISEAIADGIGGTLTTDLQYRAKNIAFSPVDMTGATEHSNLSNSIAPTGFSFDFFDTGYSEVWANQDGTLSFTQSFTANENIDLSRPVSGQTRPTVPLIAALWDDLLEATSTGLDGKIVWKANDFDGDGDLDLAIQWADYRYVNDFGTHDPINFQSVLFGDGSIRLSYLDLESHPHNESDATVNETGGISATVGIWGGVASTITIAEGQFVPGLHSLDGSVFEFVGLSTTPERNVDTNDSYIRMAWDTGGSVWDIGIIDEYAPDINSQTGQPFGINSPEANALRDAFFESLGNQILRADAAGNVFRGDQVLLSLNLGHASGVVEGFVPDDGTYTDDLGANAGNSDSDTNSVDVASNAVPSVGDPATKVQAVFQDLRTAESGQSDLHLTIDQIENGNPLHNGSYIVELFFEEYDSLDGGEDNSRIFDVVLDGTTMLNDYDVYADRAKITTLSAVENDSVVAGRHTAIVKRFLVEVRGGDGLQIDLIREAGSFAGPILSAVRILDNGPPRVVDVIISGSNSIHDAYSFAEAFSQGIHEFQTVPVGGADTVQIAFSEWVDVEKSDLWLYGGHTETTYTAIQNEFTFLGFDDHTLTATWVFDVFPADKLVIGLNFLSTIHDTAGNQLDAEWAYPMGLADPHQTIFPSGDGDEGGMFFFTFVILPGDNNLDNIVGGSAFMWWLRHYAPEATDKTFVDGDFDGDGDVDSADLALLESNFGLNFTSW